MGKNEPSIEDLLKDVSFQRWIVGEASEEECRRWDQWIRQRPEHREAAREAARALRLARFKPSDEPGEVDEAWARIRRVQQRSERRSAFRRERRPVPSRRQGTMIGSWGRRAAAFLALTLIGLGLWWVGVQPDPGAAPAETIIRTAYGERTSLTLPNGTAIVLNANSQLHLFIGDDGRPAREVYLEGEAFFDVATVGKGANRRPFLVHTADGTVRVLGTQFSVARRESRTRVALNEGRVAVHVQRDASTGEAAVTLRPGQLAAFGPEVEAIHVREVNPKVYSSWTTNTLVFDETPVAVIARRIEHTYGLEVRAQDRSVLRETISGRVENDLNVLIIGLSRLLGRPIHRTEGAIVIE